MCSVATTPSQNLSVSVFSLYLNLDFFLNVDFSYYHCRSLRAYSFSDSIDSISTQIDKLNITCDSRNNGILREQGSLFN